MAGNLEISTVVGCKMRCDYCPQKSHIENYSNRVGKMSLMYKMTLFDFMFYIESVPTEVDIVFAGMAEPFLNPMAIKMIQYAYDKGHKVSVYTTGEGIKANDIKILKNINFNHFCLHLPDADGKMNLNVDEEYLNTLKELNGIYKNVMCIGKLHPKVKELLGYDVADSTFSLYSRAGALKDLMIPRKSGKLFCSSCTDSLNHNILMPNGDVLLCCMDYNMKHIIGNLNTIKYSELFESEEYKKVLIGLTDENIDILCRTCEISKNI
jgi:sulfatase maturation enzyme AslB (radical SAM superfamily)